VPTGLDDVAVVEHVNPLPRTETVSPFWRPVTIGDTVGGLLPYDDMPEEAVMVTGAGVTVTEPFWYEMA
jgi:hypothetical protein